MTTIAFDKLTVEDRTVLAQSSGMLPVFEDPISFEIMEKAMMTPCGHSFSEDSISGWLQSNSHCPLCNKTLKRSEVLPNYALRTAIARFVTAQKHLQLNIQASALNMAISSECWPSAAQLDLRDWKVIRVENEFEGELTTDSKVLVELISARELRTDWFGKINPYCVAEFSDQRKKSKVVHNNRSPKWEETFVFNIPNAHSEDSLVITLWDKDRILKDRFLGMKKRPNSRKRIRGDILLRVQFLDLRKSYEMGRNERPLTAIISTSTPPSPASSMSLRHTLPPLPPLPQLVPLQQPLQQSLPPQQPQIPPQPPQQSPALPPPPPLLQAQEIPSLDLNLEPHNANQHSRNNSNRLSRPRLPPPLPPPRRGSLWLRYDGASGDSSRSSNNNNNNHYDSGNNNSSNSEHDMLPPPSPRPHRRKLNNNNSGHEEYSDVVSREDNDHDGISSEDVNESLDGAGEHLIYRDSSSEDAENQRQLWEAMGVLLAHPHNELVEKEKERARHLDFNVAREDNIGNDRDERNLDNVNRNNINNNINTTTTSNNNSTIIVDNASNSTTNVNNDNDIDNINTDNNGSISNNDNTNANTNTNINNHSNADGNNINNNINITGNDNVIPLALEGGNDKQNNETNGAEFGAVPNDGEVEEILHQRRNRRSIVISRSINNNNTTTTTTTTTTTSCNNNHNNNTTSSSNNIITTSSDNITTTSNNITITNNNTTTNQNEGESSYIDSDAIQLIPPPAPLKIDRLSPFELPLPPPPPPPADLSIPINTVRPAYLNVVINEDDVKSLAEMGFQDYLARFALKYCDNDVEAALDRLLNHTDELQLDVLKSLFFS